MPPADTPTPGRYRVKEQRDYATLERFWGVRSHSVAGVHEMIAEIVRERLEPGAQVLDLACGAGALTLRLQQAGYRLTACDLISDKLEIRGGVDFVQADLNQDFAPKFAAVFDAVVASEIIEHVENPRHFLREVRKIIRLGGTLIVSTPNIDSPLSKAIFLRTGRHRWFTDSDYEESGHITPMSEACLRRALVETRFEIERIQSGGTVPLRGWWKMRLLARLMSLVGTGEGGEILIVVARRTESS